MKYLFAIIFILFISFFSIPRIQAIVSPKNINVDERKIIYPLPYPGLLPDNPLYFIKKVRDDLFVFSTRDSLKKAQLYLLLSDKHIAAALMLAEKGKEEMAISQLEKSEMYFYKIPSLLSESKKQGNGASNDFINKLNQSNIKHAEIITEVMKKSTQQHIQKLQLILEANKKLKTTLKGL